MNVKSCVFPGSFDPVTNGHLDLIRRAAMIFDRVTVTVMENVAKRCAFTVEERKAFLRKCCADMPNVKVDSWQGLLADYMAANGETLILRGVRSVSDYISEQESHEANRLLQPCLETVLLLSKPELAVISSSLVREAAHFGADLTALVPAEILNDVSGRLCRGSN